jgi:hypothetical protein
MQAFFIDTALVGNGSRCKVLIWRSRLRLCRTMRAAEQIPRAKAALGMTIVRMGRAIQR